MGADLTTCLIYGIVLSKEQEDYVNKYWSKDYLNLPILQYIEGRPETEGYILLMDGMCGKYIIFGKILASSDQEETIKKIPMPDDNDLDKIIEHFARCFPEEIKLGNEIKLMMVQHYS